MVGAKAQESPGSGSRDSGWLDVGKREERVCERQWGEGAGEGRQNSLDYCKRALGFTLRGF